MLARSAVSAREEERSMRSRHARLGVALLSVALPVVLHAAVPAHAAARAVEDACVFADEAPFRDRPGGEVGVAIDCVAHYRITTGVTATLYDPVGAVRRDQMASF